MYCMDCHQNKLTLFTCEIVVFNDNNEIKRTFARILFRKYIERSGLTNVGVLDQDFRRPKQGVLAVLLINYLLDKKGRKKRWTYPGGILNIFSKMLKIEVFPSLPYNTHPPPTPNLDFFLWGETAYLSGFLYKMSAHLKKKLKNLRLKLDN